MSTLICSLFERPQSGKCHVVCVLCCSTWWWFETAVCSELCHLKDTFITQWKGERKM